MVDKLKKFDSTDDVEFYPIALLYALDVMCGELKSTVDLIVRSRQDEQKYKSIDRDRETCEICSIRQSLEFIVIFKLLFASSIHLYYILKSAFGVIRLKMGHKINRVKVKLKSNFSYLFCEIHKVQHPMHKK